MFESNYVSRCARGQGLKIKVPGCGVPQLGTGLQCAHSSLEGVDEQSALCFFFPPLPVSGLILRWWIMTPQVSCLLLWQCLPMAPRQNVSHVKHSGWKTSGEVVFGLSWSRGLRLASDLLRRESLEVLKYSISLRAEQMKSFSTTSLIRNVKREVKVQYAAGRAESRVWLIALTKDRPFHPLPGAERQ